jgi:hypothetical protein
MELNRCAADADESGMGLIPIVSVATLVISLLAGLGVAAVLGRIATRVSQLDDELWAAMPSSAQPLGQ